MSISPLLNKDVEAFADNSPVMMWSADRSGARDWFNRTWLEFRGRDIAEEIGFGWTEGVHPQDLPASLAVAKTAFEEREPFQVEFRLRRHDGVYRWILARGNPYQQEGAFGGFLGSCFDITDHRSNEEKLSDALIEREALLREVHHRVKNNLQTLMALMRFMRRSATQDGREVLDVLNMRLVTMALVQKHLHSADTITEVSATGMLAAILPELGDMGLGIELELDPTSVDLVLQGQASAYLGLAVSEAILLFAQGASKACQISLVIDEGGRAVRMVGAGGALEASQVLLGQRLVRQYARGAGATVEMGEAPNGPQIMLTFPA
ncbi:MAG: signal transduction histidine kinase [Hyphomicrobiales bacterium]|nr:signal transduction histidine kinase [Hyphomicrobiales bacterium]